MDPFKPLLLLAAASSLADVAAQSGALASVGMYNSVLHCSLGLSGGAKESKQLVQLCAAAVRNCLGLLLSSAAHGQQQDVPADAMNVISILCLFLAGFVTQPFNSVLPGEREQQLARRLAQQIWDEGVKSTLADACCMAAVALEDRKEQQQRQQQQAKQQPQQSASGQPHAQQQQQQQQQQQHNEAAAAAVEPSSAADLSFALLKLWCSMAAHLRFSGAMDFALQQAFIKTTFSPVGRLAAVVLSAWQPLSASSGGCSTASDGGSGRSSSSRTGVDPNEALWGFKVGTLDKAVREAACAAWLLAEFASNKALCDMIGTEPAMQQMMASDEMLQLMAFTTAHAAHGLHAAYAGRCVLSPTGEAAMQLSVPAYHMQLLQAVGGQWVGREGFEGQWHMDQAIAHVVCTLCTLRNAIRSRYTLLSHRCSSSSSSSSSPGREAGSSSSVQQPSQPQQEQQGGVAPPACVVPAHLQLPWLRALLELALLTANNPVQETSLCINVPAMDTTLDLMALLVMVMGMDAEAATAPAAAGTAAAAGAGGRAATANAPAGASAEAAVRGGTSAAAEAPAEPAAPHAAAPAAAAAGATGLRLPAATAAALLAPVLRLLSPAVLHVLKQSEPGSGQSETGATWFTAGSSVARDRIGIMQHYSSLLTTMCLSVEPRHLATACFNQAEPSAILVSCTVLESSLRAQAGGLGPQQLHQHLPWGGIAATGQQLPLASSISRACDGPNVQQQLAAASVTAAAGAVGMVALENEVFALLLSSLKCAAAAARSSTDPRIASKDCWQIVEAAACAAHKLLGGDSAARATANSGGSSSSRPAAESSTALWLVIMARAMHVAGQQVAELAQESASAQDASQLPAAELFTNVVQLCCVNVNSLISVLPLISEEQAASDWSASGRALGVPQLLLQQLQEAGKQLSQALQHAYQTNSSSSSQQGSAELAALAADLGQQLQAYGAAVCAQLPLRLCCNAPGCVNLSKTSEMLLVEGKGSVCAGCGEARYCGRQCQLAHWKQHRPVCQRLKGGGVGGGGSGSSSGAQGSESK